MNTQEPQSPNPSASEPPLTPPPQLPNIVPPPVPPTFKPEASESTTPRPVLATIAMVLAILSPVPCCPFVGFISAPLSILCLWRTRSSDERRTRQIARAALVLSLVGLVVQALTYEALSEWLTKDLTKNMNASIRAALENEYAKSVITIAAHPIAPAARPAPTAQQMQIFSNTARQRYGQLQDVSIISQTGDGGMFDVALTCAISLKFERRETTGSAMFQLVPQSDRWIPATRLLELTIDDATLGDILLAAPASTQPAALPTAATQPAAVQPEISQKP